MATAVEELSADIKDIIKITQDKYTFISSGYSQIILEHMKDLLLKREFCDVTVVVGDSEFPAHRVVLSACSEYFSSMFTGGLKESKQQSVTMHGIEPCIFKLLLDFIYSGKLEVNSTNVQDLLSAADMLGLADLVRACCNFLHSQLHHSNAIGINMLAEAHSCKQLSDNSMWYILSNFVKVSQSDEFLSLSVDKLLDLLHSEDIHIEDEFQVFVAAINWIQYDVTGRRRHLVDVMGAIRFPIISANSLFSYIENCSDLTLRIACLTLLAEYRPERRLLKDWKQKKNPHALSLTTIASSSQHRNQRMMKSEPRIHARKYLYVIGGYNSEHSWLSDVKGLNIVEYYDSISQTWSTMWPPLRHCRSGHGVAVLDGSIYVIGGESDLMIYDTVERFDTVLKQWIPMPNMNTPRAGLGACTSNEVIYAFGGWVGTDIGDNIECFDPQANQWFTLGRMMTPRYALGVVEMNGMIYVLGGMDSLGMELDTVECYYPVTRKWTRLPSMQTRRAYVGVAIVAEQLYAIGGYNSRNEALKTVEKYSFDEERWTHVTPMSVPRAGCAVSSMNGRLFVVGGRNNDGSNTLILSTIECYDPITDCWILLDDMPTPRSDTTAVVL